jgi:hypothetical protein
MDALLKNLLSVSASNHNPFYRFLLSGILISIIIVFEDEELNNRLVAAVEKTVHHEDNQPDVTLVENAEKRV